MNPETRRQILESAGVTFAPGLNASEARAAEKQYGFTFPPDLLDFLGYALPVSKGWIDWRNGPEAKILDALRRPYEGICFDIEHNNFWLPEWGQKPASLEARFAVAREIVQGAPKLVPVCGHRYMPDRPNEAGNPVFSVWQTDIIYYGSNLQNYLENEFYYYFKAPEYRLQETIREIEFWTQFAG